MNFTLKKHDDYGEIFLEISDFKQMNPSDPPEYYGDVYRIVDGQKVLLSDEEQDRILELYEDEISEIGYREQTINYYEGVL